MPNKVDQRITVEAPILSVYLHGRDMICTLDPPHDFNYEQYALLICDLVRHVARAFEIEEDDVWQWVERERANPTSTLSSPS